MAQENKTAEVIIQKITKLINELNNLDEKVWYKLIKIDSNKYEINNP